MSGSLVCVGTGMILGAHISPIARSQIEQADVVYYSMSNGIVERWIENINPNAHSLQSYYQEGKHRSTTYQEMVEAIISAVRTGQKVVAAFYGHPGIFACVAHNVIEQAIAEGYPAHMEPGISAESCLYADLGIDPGKTGCQHYEASQFMFYKRNIDPAAYLILWQVGLAGDTSIAKYASSQAQRQVLVDLLLQSYQADHQVILYQSKVLPIDKVRQDKIALSELATAELFLHTTLVIPPGEKMMPNNALRDKLLLLDKQAERPKLTLVDNPTI